MEAQTIDTTPAGATTKPSAAELLYVCDFPPSNDSGGPILMKRLLQSYAPDHVIVFTNSVAFRLCHTADRLSCPHVLFPKFGVSKRLWVGKLKHLLNWAVLACVSVTAIVTILQRHVAVLVTVFHDRYFLAAAAAGWLTRKPYVVVGVCATISFLSKCPRPGSRAASSSH